MIPSSRRGEIARVSDIQKANSGNPVSTTAWTKVNTSALQAGARYELILSSGATTDQLAAFWSTGTAAPSAGEQGRLVGLYAPVVIQPEASGLNVYVRAVSDPSGLSGGGYLASLVPAS